jgi:hypothetical protein
MAMRHAQQKAPNPIPIRTAVRSRRERAAPGQTTAQPTKPMPIIPTTAPTTRALGAIDDRVSTHAALTKTNAIALNATNPDPIVRPTNDSLRTAGVS